MPTTSTQKYIQPSEVSIKAGDGGKRVAVFCGSASDLHPEYHQAATHLVDLLAAKKCALVYGGGSWGLMGTIAQRADHHGLPILGVLPDFMQTTCGKCFGENVIVEGMAERKTVIDAHADVFVILPGGFGTQDEMSEMLTWNQLGINNKLIGILNTRGFYTAWWDWCQRAVKEGFVREIYLKNIIFANTPEELVDQIVNKNPEPIPGKFITRA